MRAPVIVAVKNAIRLSLASLISMASENETACLVSNSLKIVVGLGDVGTNRMSVVPCSFRQKSRKSVLFSRNLPKYCGKVKISGVVGRCE